jgi:predicted hotdog family 3-hydroxylacyl-ACP dehydratase
MIFMDDKLKDIDILDIIPQRPPFVVVDCLRHFDRVKTCTELLVRGDNIFVENTVFRAAGVIENIAQTCAARIGYINSYLQKDEVKLGFIGAIKNLEIHALPRVGDVLHTTVEVLGEVFALTLVKAQVEVNGKLMAECEMKIALSE